jgi:RimJ/RimL family protein N-acetyltransferase
MTIKITDRLSLRKIDSNDAQFILDLYNQPAFKENIGDRGVNTLDDAKKFIEATQRHYEHYGFWLYLIEEKSSGSPVGVNGLIQRDYLNAPDIGFAIDENHWRKGYAYESSQAVIRHAADIGYKELLAITSTNNHSSIQLLIKLGFGFAECNDFEGNGEKINLYKINLLV